MREGIKKALEDLAALQNEEADGLEEEVEFLSDAIKWLSQARDEAMNELEREEAEACPGCGCKPGDGITESCEHPEGCGFFKSEEAREWKAYEAAYLAAQKDEEAIDDQIATWERAVQAYGKPGALRRYWDFMKKLPRDLRSDCDPYGN